MTQRIEVSPPLADVRRKLVAVDGRFKKELQKTNKRIAETLGERVRDAYAATHASQSGHGRASIRPRASQLWSGIALGGTRAPYVLGQNFGSRQGPRKRQFRLFAEPDYFLYRQVAKDTEEIEQMHGEMVEQVMQEAFPGSTGALARRLV